jgi:hypothetical protein
MSSTCTAANAFKASLFSISVFDAAVFGLSLYSPDLLYRLAPYFVHKNEQSARYLGYVFLLLGLSRLHGCMSITEKGAYRLMAWSWIVELGIHAVEYSKQEINTHDSKLLVVLTVCSAMLLVTIFFYKEMLYPNTPLQTASGAFNTQVSRFKDFWRKGTTEVNELVVPPSSPVADKKAN